MSDQVGNRALVLAAAERLSAMADKVAGFAISSDLLLTFACLKDISSWVQHKTSAFLIGTGLGGFAYIAAVWWLYFREFDVRAKAELCDVLSPLDNVSRSLVWARSIGIAFFTMIAMLAVWGTRVGP